MAAIDELSIAVVGARYENEGPGNRETEIRLTLPGEPVELRHEPKNKRDANAIAVFSARGIQMGYVSAERTAIIHRAWLDAREIRAIFQKAVAEWGAWIHVAFDREPTLPPAGQPRPPRPPAPKRGEDGWIEGDRHDGVDEIPEDY